MANVNSSRQNPENVPAHRARGRTELIGGHVGPLRDDLGGEGLDGGAKAIESRGLGRHEARVLPAFLEEEAQHPGQDRRVVAGSCLQMDVFHSP